MNKILATLLALTLAFTLNSAARAGHGGHGGHGHIGHFGHRHFGHGHGYRLRHFGRFSHRHWWGRYHRWMYFHPGYHRWYYQAGANWMPVSLDDSPAFPGVDDADE